MKIKNLWAIFLVIGLVTFVSAEPLTLEIIRDKMIWDLPELSGFTFGGGQEQFPSFTRISLRYISPEDNDQHSEFGLHIYDDVLSDSFLNEEVVRAQSNWNDLTLRETNGNKIFEGTAEASAGIQRYVFWISDNNLIRSWNGNDLGNVIDDVLFDVLIGEYLEKYPSTYQSSEEQRVLYAEKIPDPNRFISIQPIWSSSLDKSGEAIIVSVLRFEWLSGETTSEAEMIYLEDASGKYLADGATFSYSQTHEFTCDPGYDSCVSACGIDETCIDQCTIDYNCATQSSCEITAPDNSCGMESITASFGSTQLLLNFDPATGQLVETDTTYNNQKLTIVTQAGFLSQEVFRAK